MHCFYCLEEQKKNIVIKTVFSKTRPKSPSIINSSLGNMLCVLIEFTSTANNGPPSRSLALHYNEINLKTAEHKYKKFMHELRGLVTGSDYLQFYFTYLCIPPPSSLHIWKAWVSTCIPYSVASRRDAGFVNREGMDFAVSLLGFGR